MGHSGGRQAGWAGEPVPRLAEVACPRDLGGWFSPRGFRRIALRASSATVSRELQILQIAAQTRPKAMIIIKVPSNSISWRQMDCDGCVSGEHRRTFPGGAHA